MSDLTKEELEAVLVQIATNNDLRAQIEADPVAALAPFGLSVDPSHAPPTMTVTLMPGQEILDNLQQLSTAMASEVCAAHFIHQIWTP